MNVAFHHYQDGDIVRYDAENDEPKKMTIVTCDVRAGRSAAMLESLGHAITVLCSQELGVEESRVAVYISEHAAAQIYRDGGRAPAWSPSERT